VIVDTSAIVAVLLFGGDAFTHTDVTSALPPQAPPSSPGAPAR
jgi:hypothetical protein